MKKKNKTKGGNDYDNYDNYDNYENDNTYDNVYQEDISFKLLGSGTYGCVIKPAIFFDDNKNYIKNDYIAKVLYRKSSFDDEIKQLQMIQKIDPDNTFTVKIVNTEQTIKYKDIRNIPDLYDCIKDKLDTFLDKRRIEMDRDEKDNYVLYEIIQEYGGTPLAKINADNTKITFKNAVVLLETFLSGIEKMHNNGLIHLDIKPDNMVLSSTKLSLIDFGLSSSIENVFVNDKNYLLESAYLYYPDEFNIARHMMDNQKKTGLQFLKEMIKYIETDQKFHQSLFIKHKENMLLVQKALLMFVEDIYKNAEKTNTLNDISFSSVFNESLALKSDVYSLASLIKIFNDIIDYNNSHQKNFIQILFDFCKQPNPYKRKDIFEIVKKFKKMKDAMITNNYI